MSDRYSRDKNYGKPPVWTALYRRFFPKYTDGCSRHVVIIAEQILRDPKSPVRRLLIDEGYEPDHWASSMEVTVRCLWEARAELARLKGPAQVQRETEAAVAKAVGKMRRLGSKRVSEPATAR